MGTRTRVLYGNRNTQTTETDTRWYEYRYKQTTGNSTRRLRGSAQIDYTVTDTRRNAECGDRYTLVTGIGTCRLLGGTQTTGTGTRRLRGPVNAEYGDK